MTRIEVLATPKAGVTKDDLLAAVVAAVGDVTRTSTGHEGRVGPITVEHLSAG